MISKKLYSENKVPPLTGFPLREGMENFDKPIERTDKSNTANIIDLIKSIRSDKDGNQYQVPLFKYPKGSKLVIYRGPYLDEIIDAFEANKDAGGTPDFEKFKKDLFNFRFQKMNSQITNPAKISETKKTIARLKTILKGKLNA